MLSVENLKIKSLINNRLKKEKEKGFQKKV